VPVEDDDVELVAIRVTWLILPDLGCFDTPTILDVLVRTHMSWCHCLADLGSNEAYGEDDANQQASTTCQGGQRQ